MVSFKFLVPTLLLAASGVVAAPITTARDISEVIVPAPHAHVSAESLWDKKTAHVDLPRRDLSGLGPENWNSGTVEVKTTAFNLWSPSSWGWWKRSADAALQRRQDEEFQFDPELLASLGPSIQFGTTEVKSKAFNLWSPSSWGWWKRSADATLQRRQDEEFQFDPELLASLGPSIQFGTTEVKSKAFNLWSPSSWGWWKRSADAGVQRRQEDVQFDPELVAALSPSNQFGSADVKTTSFSLWSPSSWGWWKRSADAGLQRRQEDVQVDPELLASLGPSISFGTAEVKTKSFDLWSPSSWWGWWN